MATPQGQLLRRALDLQFFAGQHIPLCEPTVEEAIVIRMVESERGKIEEADRKRREIEARAQQR